MYPDSLLDDLREFYSEPDLQRLKCADIAEIANADVDTPAKKRRAAMRVLRVLEYRRKWAENNESLCFSAIFLPPFYLHIYIANLVYYKLDSYGFPKTKFGMMMAACCLLLIITWLGLTFAIFAWCTRTFWNGKEPVDYFLDRFENRTLTERLTILRYWSDWDKDSRDQARTASIRPKDAFMLGFGREFGRLAAKVTIVLLAILGAVLLSIVLNLIMR